VSAKLRGRAARLPAADIDLTQGDTRFLQGQEIIRQAEAGRKVVVEVFNGTDLGSNEDRIRDLLGARTEVVEQWGKGQRAFLAIGRILLRLSRTLSEEEFICLRRGSERLFPFGDSTATKLRMVAQMVDEGDVREEQLPAYTVAYELSTLPRDGLRLARERNLIRPNVRRTEITSLRRELRGHKLPTGTLLAPPTVIESGHRVSLEALERQRAALLAEQESLRARLGEVERVLASVTEQLTVVLGGNGEDGPALLVPGDPSLPGAPQGSEPSS